MKSEENVAAWLAGAPAEVTRECARLMDEVAALRDEQAVYPAQDDILNALAYTGPADVRAVVLGQDPYHEPGQAMGLAFSVPRGERLPPSLRNVYKEMAADLGCAAPTSGDLTPWAEQGVLLLNTTLTVRAHAANSHAKLGWQALTGWVVRACMALPQPVVFLAWGRPSIRLIEAAREQAACEMADRGVAAGPLASKFVLASTHPSPLSATRAAGELPAFIGSRPFSQANRILEEHGTRPIDWTRVA